MERQVWATWKGDASCPYFSQNFSDYDLKWSMNHVTVGFVAPCGMYFETEWGAIGGLNVDHEWDHYNGIWGATHRVTNGRNSEAVATLTIQGVPSPLVSAPGASIWRQTASSTMK
jgi:hypothetical protein